MGESRDSKSSIGNERKRAYMRFFGIISRTVGILKQPAAIFMIIILVMWELICRFLNVPTYLLPAPHQIVLAFYKNIGPILNGFIYTLQETASGFLVGSILSVIFGILITYYSVFRKIFLPYVVLIQNLPKLAIAPLFIVWFGFTFLTTISIVVSLSAFPVLINFVAGLEGSKQEEMRLMRSYNATKWQTFYHVRLFRSMPFLFAGLKLGIVLSVAGAVVAEFVAGHSGLAYLMLLASSTIRIPLMFACLFTIGVLGLLLYMVVSLAQTILMPWAKNTDQSTIDATM